MFRATTETQYQTPIDTNIPVICRQTDTKMADMVDGGHSI